MRKFAIVALTLALGASLLAGCRGGNPDMTMDPTDSSTGQNNTSMPSEGARSGNNNGFQEENSHNRIQPQLNG